MKGESIVERAFLFAFSLEKSEVRGRKKRTSKGWRCGGIENERTGREKCKPMTDYGRWRK